MPDALLHRREVIQVLLRDREDLIVVAGLGGTVWDVASMGDSDLDFPIWGAMGSTAMVGLGLALAQPSRRVLVVTGDGEMLMGIGSLATIAVQRPRNLRIVVMDNECYGETGQQPTHTAQGTDLAGIALACGFPRTHTVWHREELEPLRTKIYQGNELCFAAVKVAVTENPKTFPPRDGAYLKNRLRAALLGKQAALE